MMKRLKKSLLVLAAILFALPSFLVTAASNESKPGEISSKDEVVYAKLSANGERQEIYVVNILDINKAGKIVDYGHYSNLKNLSDLAPLEQIDNTVEFTATEGKFYYQGNMNEKALPWNISVSYLLDGKQIAPEELAGKEGHVEIRIATSANKEVDQVFFENYLLQISLTLNLELFSDIQAPNGMLANAGKSKQVTFTVMPEKEEELVVEADVVDFELDGIDITAIPSSLPIDAPNIDDMTGEIHTLTDAIKEVDDGVGALANGVSELNNGVKGLSNGSKQYKDGMYAIAHSSSELVNASGQIEGALDKLSTNLSANSENMNLGDVKKLEEGLVQISGGLKETTKGLTTLKENYATAYSALNTAMAAIPEYEISEEQIQQLYGSGADQQVLDQLIETYSTARTAKGTYLSVQEAFVAVDGTLVQVSGALLEMASQLEQIANGLSTSLEEMNIAESITQLRDGVSQLSSNYRAFHSGLVKYTGGVSQLSSSYSELHNGVVALSDGTGKLESGASQLHDGTTELYEATSDLPEQIKEEVDQMMSEYDKSDFEPVSFVSSKNEDINSVQFVLKTESIKQEEAEESEKTVEEVKGFWARLVELFK
nr:YhgE/Pip domain-containing protein [Litchfieldia salsa]